jgi:hypothetical protein
MMTLLLTGCTQAAPERKLGELRRTLSAAEELAVTAEVTANLGEERFSCTLRCTSTPEQTEVEVLAPETVAGIRAVTDAEGMQLQYEGLSLGVGGWEPDAAPVTALPLLLRAMQSGSTLRSWTEWEGERTLFVRELYVTDDTTLTVWLDGGTLLPVHAEFSRGGETLIRCEITEFTYQ